MVRFEEFKVSDLLQTVDTNKLNLKKGDCPTSPIGAFDLPARTATTTNHGLSCYVPRDTATVLRDKISVSANGDFCAFWHDSDFTILQDSYALEGKGFVLNKYRGLFFVSVMYKAFALRYNWNNKSRWKKIKEESIQLPIQTTDNQPILDPDKTYHPEGYIPDWDFMEKCVGEFEELRVAELEAYLVETGLSDYQLTDEDIEILSSLGIKDGDALKLCEEFKIVDIAKVEYGNKFDKNKMSRQNPSINFVSRTASNNGVSDFVDNNGTVPYKEGLITLALGGSIGSCFLQEQPFYTGQNVGVIDLGDIDYHAKIYFTEALGYKCKQSFSAFGNEINKHLKTDLSVSLPIKQDEKGNPVIDPEHKYHPEGHIPDWEFMERYIRAIEKVVIADVVKYKDEVIEKTKEVVG